MPDLDGFEVLEMVREISSVPVIMLTAKGEEDDRVRGLELGADDYVTKPFSLGNWSVACGRCCVVPRARLVRCTGSSKLMNA